MCNGEIMGKDHTLEFVYMTRWRIKVRKKKRFSKPSVLSLGMAYQAIKFIVRFSMNLCQVNVTVVTNGQNAIFCHLPSANYTTLGATV